MKILLSTRPYVLFSFIYYNTYHGWNTQSVLYLTHRVRYILKMHLCSNGYSTGTFNINKSKCTQLQTVTSMCFSGSNTALHYKCYDCLFRRACFSQKPYSNSTIWEVDSSGDSDWKAVNHHFPVRLKLRSSRQAFLNISWVPDILWWSPTVATFCPIFLTSYQYM